MTMQGFGRPISEVDAIAKEAGREASADGFLVGLRELAQQRRNKLFALLGDGVGAVVSTVAANKGYLSGYHSMGHDVSPAYASAVVADRNRAALVVSAADAGPALEAIGDEELIFRYGKFFFESSPQGVQLQFDEPGFPDFLSALARAVAVIAPPGACIGLDAEQYFRTAAASVCGARRIVDASEAVLRARQTKLDGEIERIRRATLLTEQGIGAVRTSARAGMTEYEIAALVTERMVAGGGTPRFVSVTSGPRSALADAYPTSRKVAPGDLVRIDAGCVVDGFSSDVGRTFVVGEPDQMTRDRYAAILSGLEAELAVVRPGVRAGDLFATAVDATRAAGLPSFRRHHCGHGLGIGGYEAPIIREGASDLLEAGMCLCLETPYYQIGWGGMMVEDTVLVTPDGYAPISRLSREFFHL